MPKTIHAILHTHALHPAPLDNDELRAALGVGTDADLNIMRLEGACDVRRVEDVDWRAEQLHLAAWFEKHEHKLKETAYAEVAYFGATCIPLAMDLGARLTTWKRPRVFHQRHGGQGWVWPGRVDGENGPGVRVTGLPDEADPNARGPVVVSVASSYSIADVDLETMRRDAIATVRIDLDPIPLDHNPYSTQEELERTVAAFDWVISKLKERRPSMTELRVAIAGPVGLILRLGGSINPTIYPPVIIWNYVAGSTPRYKPALQIGRALESLNMKHKLLFLAADASKKLQQDEEHAGIQRRIEAATYRDRFELTTHLAMRVEDLQSVLGRTKPAILHFSGHGDASGRLQGVAGKAGRGMPPDAVARAIQLTNRNKALRLVVLNACWSQEVQEELIHAEAVDFVIATTDKIADDVAVVFATELYRALAEGETVRTAFELADNQTRLGLVHETPDPLLFRLRARPGANPDTTRLFE
ncbi:SAVED domain-containing protein [Myxococcota bacterium]|nr:SAVED domain-containing protein [Myxococcota bacterium]